MDDKGIRGELEKFLYARLNVHATARGQSLILNVEISHKEARRLIKRFLHEAGVQSNYKVTSVEGAFIVQPIPKRTKRRGGKGTSPPPPSRTLPYFFP